MPEIDYGAISQIFREKSSHNQDTLPPSADNPNATVVADDHRGEEGQNTPSRPASSQLPLDFSREQMRRPYAGTTGADARVGFVLTSDWWRTQPKPRAIQLHAGPQSVSWSLGLRAQDEENKAGHARYAQARTSFHGGSRDPNPIWFDFPRLQFQFQAGNLIPISGFANEVVVPYGLQDFYLFMELLNQPPLIPAGQYEGKHNYVWIFYTSLQFPQITLKGYFEPDGVTWEDNAENPTTLQWNASFIAHEMTPNLWESDEMLSAYTDFMTSNVRQF